MRLALPLAAALLLAACATATPESTLPKDAIAATRTEANGDSITEYRVAGTLKMVKVVRCAARRTTSTTAMATASWTRATARTVR